METYSLFAVFNLPFGGQRVALLPYSVTTVLDQVDCVDAATQQAVKTTQINFKTSDSGKDSTYVRVTESLEEVLAILERCA